MAGKLKKKLWIIGGAVIVVLAVLLIAPNLIDWNRFKPQVESGFEAATGRQLQIAGNLSFKLLPSPALSVQQVSLANVPWAQEQKFMELEALDLRLKLIPLLSRDFVITSLVLDGGRINLERSSEGRANWEELFAKEEPAKEEQVVSLDSFILRDTGVSYYDHGSGERTAVSAIDARLTVGSLTGPFSGRGTFTYNGVRLEFRGEAGKFAEGATVPVTLTFGTAGEGGTFDFSGTYVDEEGIVALSGKLTGRGANVGFVTALMDGEEAARKGPLWGKNYRIDTSLIGVMTDGKSDLTLEPLAFTLAGDEGEGVIKGVYTDALEAEARLTLNSLNLDQWLAENEADEEPFELPEDVSAVIALEAAAVTYRKGEIKNASLAARLGGGALTLETFSGVLPGNSALTLSGELRSGSRSPVFEGRASLQTNQLRTLLGWLEAEPEDIPRARLNRLTFEGRLRYADPLLEVFGARVNLDTSRFSGGLTANLDEAGSFAVASSVDALDLDSYFPFLAEKSREETLAGRIRALHAALEPLADFNAVLDLKAGRLRMMAADARDATFKGSLKGGSVVIEDVSAGDFEGTSVSLKGSLTEIPGDMGFDLDARFSSANLLPFMGWMEIESPFKEGYQPKGTLRGKFSGKLSQAKFDLAGELAGASFAIFGDASALASNLTYSADMTITHSEMITFVNAFVEDYAPAKRPLGMLSLAAKVRGSETAYTFPTLTLKLGPALIEGNLAYGKQGVRPKLTGALNARALVLDDFMAPVEAGLQQVVAQGGERWSKDEWDLTLVRENDIDIGLSAERIDFRTYRLTAPELKIRATDGVLTVENLTSGLYGGRLSANATLDARQTPKLDLEMAITGVPTRDLLKASADISALTGTARLSGTFRASGNSQFAIISTLEGSANVATETGVIRGVNLPRLSERLGTLNSLNAFTSLLGTALEGGETPYRFIRTKAQARQGVLTFERLESDVDAAEIGGRGTVDLPRWTVDMSGVVRLKDLPAVPAIGVRIQGRADSPQVRYDTQAMTAYMTKQFTTTLFQNLLGQPQPPAEGGTGTGAEAPAEGEPAPSGTEAEQQPSAEETIVKGLFELLGKQKQEEPPAEEEEEGGGLRF